ncbi:hypothetical protein FHS83_000043 [Rhizomicrobium palustre]|uniref:Uncharacterized protein n=1 Tax=Rhizomicrobium palustre TaxID=189966 RepID=A0A846MU22_9PROT|nr:hypothetical protein [Rhizomicrobium palustre]NIK86725.1 hypothetical protein [Rhizomicrobium palustre]
MKRNLAAAFLFLCGSSYAADLSLEAVGPAGNAVPITFGMVFAPGEIKGALTARDKNGAVLPLQVDAKARNKDGSLRHAIITTTVARARDGQAINFILAPGAVPQGAPVTRAALPGNFDAVVNLDLGTTRLSASARALLAQTKAETWLEGPLVSEWWVSGPLRDASGRADVHLTARFGLRSYGPGKPLRVEVVVENGWTYVPAPRSVAYAAAIMLGGKQVFSQERIVQQSHTRWRQVFWWDESAESYIRPPLEQLKRARAIPNYAAGIDAPADAMMRFYRAANRGPMGTGVIYPAMPVTGQRQDIGPLPGWTVSYLVGGSAAARELTLSAGDLSGSFPSHYRNEKTGRPTTSEDYPKISTHYNFVGRGPTNLPLPDLAGLAKPYTAEPAHEPSLAFVPYLLTGERYYLEELQFWSQWNSWGTAPEYHGFEKGLIGWDQIRGQGWSLRTMAQAAYITPDGDPIKPVLLRQMKANAAFYDNAYSNNRAANIFHTALRDSDTADSVAPWMDDYLSWAASYAVQLGFDEFTPFARWKAVFPVQRMINSDYCAVMATKYYMLVKDSPRHFIDSWAKLYVANLPKEYRSGPPIACGSPDMTKAFKLNRDGEMMGDSSSPNGYPAQLQPALAAAVDLNAPGAREAWAKFQARPVQPRGGVDPKWNILPWSP